MVSTLLPFKAAAFRAGKGCFDVTDADLAGKVWRSRIGQRAGSPPPRFHAQGHPIPRYPPRSLVIASEVFNRFTQSNPPH